MIKKVLTNSAIYGLAPHVPRIVSVLLLPIMTAHLTDVDYGIAGTIAAYTMALSALSTLGVSAYLQVNFFKAKCQYKILWREVYGFLQYWMVFFSVIQSVVLYFAIPDEALDNRWMIILLTNFNGVIFGPSGALGALYYQLCQRPIPIAIRSVATGLLSVVINYILIVIYEYGYMGWYVGSFAATFLMNFVYWYDLNFKLGFRPIYFPKKRTIKRTLQVSLPVVPHYYSAYLITTSNRVVMDYANIRIGEIGQFNLAQQFVTMMDSLVNAIERAIGPLCMEGIRNNKEEEVNKEIFLFTLLTFSGTFLFSIWSKEIFGVLISNPVLATPYPIAALLSLALNYRPAYIAASNVFFYYENTKQLLGITFFAGMIALLLNIVLIPSGGLWAAAIITYVAFLYQGYSGFFYKFYKQSIKVPFPYMKLFLLQLVVSAVAMLCLELHWGLKLVLTLIWGVLGFLGLYRIRGMK